ncbi:MULTISPECIES: MerR family transcriptional regulator [Paenibacillus]|uniref:Transcriptional regulator n=1 Tax=Paenibacillus campinasensis TaxID=66347 RepID=A0A268EHR3_9BACL|nr:MULTISPECIES: MerR family transcriptional regulator [Paenibacillus]PAD72667.1 transcriptional regulator [Paenibacillus campinasensis]PAK51115.1 transcriptional regulator [Paenibacillus sp. 7541]
MFKISEFSNLSRIPLQTLRYYDQIGILKPAATDEVTGYRYYNAEQLLRVNRIVILKDLGFSLQQIAQLLQEDVSAEQIRGMLRLKESEIEQRLSTEQSRLARIKERMQLLEHKGKMDKELEVVVKRVESMQMVTYASVGTVDEIPNLFGIFDRLLDSRTRSALSGPQTVLWNASGGAAHEFELEVGYAVRSETLKLPEHLQFRFLSPVTLTTLLFRSDAVYLETACVYLAEWIERRGCTIRGDLPGRETYVPLAGESGVKLIEIQIPIVDQEGLS